MLSINLTPFPTLNTERLILRRTTMADIGEIFFLRSDPRVLQYIKRHPCQSEEEAAAFIRLLDGNIENNEGVPWAISLKDSTKLIGSIGIWRFTKEHYRAEIGYVMDPEYQGQGLMQEALRAAVDYGFDTLGLHSIEANTDPENIASQRVLERTGFVREGHLRENHFFEGRFFDTVIYSMLSPAKDGK